MINLEKYIKRHDLSLTWEAWAPVLPAEPVRPDVDLGLEPN